MRAEHRIRHELINGEELVFSQPEDSVIEYLERIRHAMENPTVSEQKMLELIYHPDNPLMDPEIIPGRGMVTTRTLEHPAYRVMMDYLDRKRVESGTLDLAGTEAAYSLNVTDAANLLDIHPSAIRQAIQSGRLTAWKKGRTHHLRPESIESYEVGRRGPRKRKPRGGGVLRIRCGHSKGVRFAIIISERPATGDELIERYFDPPPRLERQRLMAEIHPQPGIVEGLLPTGWLRIGILTNLKGEGGQRFFELQPDPSYNRIEFADFFVAGKFRIARKENNSLRASKEFKEFQPQWA